MKNADVLSKIDTLKPETITNILRVADFLELPEFTDASMWGRLGQTVIVTCIDGRKYLFGLSRYGFVEIVRADSKDGEIIFVPEE